MRQEIPRSPVEALQKKIDELERALGRKALGGTCFGIILGVDADAGGNLKPET